MAIVYIMDHDAEGNPHRHRKDDVVFVTDDCPVNVPPAPPFKIIKVIGATKAELEHWHKTHFRESTDPNNPGEHEMVKRTKYHINVKKLSKSLEDEFNSQRYIEVSVNDMRKAIKNKDTGKYEDEI